MGLDCAGVQQILIIVMEWQFDYGTREDGSNVFTSNQCLFVVMDWVRELILQLIIARNIDSLRIM